jgi:hypothetical protein
MPGESTQPGEGLQLSTHPKQVAQVEGLAELTERVELLERFRAAVITRMPGLVTE